MMRDKSDMAKDAMDVLNGFKRPSEQLARDVINLVRQIERYEKEQAAEAFTKAGSSDMPDFLKGLFR